LRLIAEAFSLPAVASIVVALRIGFVGSTGY
jgi:hypothetical protein